MATKKTTTKTTKPEPKTWADLDRKAREALARDQIANAKNYRRTAEARRYDAARYDERDWHASAGSHRRTATIMEKLADRSEALADLIRQHLND